MLTSTCRAIRDSHQAACHICAALIPPPRLFRIPNRHFSTLRFNPLFSHFTFFMRCWFFSPPPAVVDFCFLSRTVADGQEMPELDTRGSTGPRSLTVEMGHARKVSRAHHALNCAGDMGQFGNEALMQSSGGACPADQLRGSVEKLCDATSQLENLPGCSLLIIVEHCRIF
ncbi:hypothetical protein B0H11DRAFT_1059978 [Mycena galericulata]|nr:hypothetical protein B0H11DRAFT_1059978 [Mycena galericulata]